MDNTLLFHIIFCYVLLFPTPMQAEIVFTEKDKPAELKLGDERYDITVQEGIGSGTEDTFKLEGTPTPYTISPVWTVFALVKPTEYDVPSWDLDAHCGFWEQKCGDQCDGGPNCFTRNINGGILNVLTMGDENWCYRITKSEFISYKKCKLEPMVHVALTSYQGKLSGEGSLEPGWTITSNKINEQVSLNALIKDILPKPTIDLSQLYVTESMGLMNEKHLEHIQKAPTAELDFDSSDCWHNSIKHKLISKPFFNAKEQLNTFEVFYIMRRAKNSLATLDEQEILSLEGIEEYSDSLIEPFIFFDPCNLQFFKLTRDKDDKTYIVNGMLGQNTQDTFCIALESDVNNPSDLVLYEFASGSRSFLPSSRFIGAISRDYIQQYTLQVSTFPVTPISGRQVNTESVIAPTKPVVVPAHHGLKVVFDDSPQKDGTFRITYESPKATSCAITLSGMISETITWNYPHQTKVITHHKKELPFLPLGLYDCEGVTGNFPIPLKYAVQDGMEVLFDVQAQDRIFDNQKISIYYHDPEHKKQTLWRIFVRNMEEDWKILMPLVAVGLTLGIIIILTVLCVCCRSKRRHEPYTVLPGYKM